MQFAHYIRFITGNVFEKVTDVHADKIQYSFLDGTLPQNVSKKKKSRLDILQSNEWVSTVIRPIQTNFCSSLIYVFAVEFMGIEVKFALTNK